MLMGYNHASPVLQSVTADTNDLHEGQRSLFLGSNVFKLSNGDSNDVFGLFDFTGDRGCMLYCCITALSQLRCGCN